MSINKIGILTLWSFPEGMAPTTRILAYTKGLVSNDVDVEIYSFKRIYVDEVITNNVLKKGNINGVKYSYIHFFNNLGKKFRFFRIIDQIILVIKLFVMIIISHNKKKIDCFIFSFDDLHSFSFYMRIFRLFNFPLFIIADEFPIPIRDFMQDTIPDDMILKYRKYHSFFSGRILMSNTLAKFYDDTISKKPTFILNTIYDIERFNISDKQELERDYICYMGNMCLNKDNVDIIIQAFDLIKETYPNIDLHLYGTPNESDKIIILNLIKALNLNNRVYFKGKASYSKVPSILGSAKILVNSQPKTKRAEGGFPTKLGEYLLTGIPSIFTDSGDISTIIQNNKHAFIVEPENIEEYSLTLKKILNNYNNSLIIGENGRDLMLNKFDNKKTTMNLIRFLSRFTKK